MITERNTIRTQQCPVQEIRKSLLSRLFFLWILLIVIGTVGVICVSVIWRLVTISNNEPLLVILLLSIFMFIIGAAFIIMTVVQNKRTADTNLIKVSGEFFSNCVIIREFKAEKFLNIKIIDYEKISEIEIKNDYFYIKLKQGAVNSGYCDDFFGVINVHSLLGVFVIGTSGLSDIELNTLKKLLNLHYEKNIKVLQPALYQPND
ncbi:MAG: hypothetical protein K2N30_01540 [Clostridia bacterium]|nr:hypothetical protein [Clostridia bacterium]